MGRMIAYYREMNYSVVRRLVGPLSVLATRGHHCFFQHADDLRALEVANYKAIFLPDWQQRIPARLPMAHGVYLYDLSDPKLLDDDTFLRVLQQCSGVTVPVEGMVDVVKPFLSRVKVLPSLVQAELFRGGTRLDFGGPAIACVGNHDWELLADVLPRALKRLPGNVRVVTDSPFLIHLLGNRAIDFPLSLLSYPSLVRSVSVALLPRNKADRDTIWAHEFGIGGVVCIGSPAYRGTITHQETGLVATITDHWEQYLTALLTDDRIRVRLQAGAVQNARLQTTIRGSDNWLRTVEKFLP